MRKRKKVREKIVRRTKMKVKVMEGRRKEKDGMEEMCL